MRYILITWPKSPSDYSIYEIDTVGYRYSRLGKSDGGKTVGRSTRWWLTYKRRGSSDKVMEQEIDDWLYYAEASGPVQVREVSKLEAFTYLL